MNRWRTKALNNIDHRRERFVGAVCIFRQLRHKRVYIQIVVAVYVPMLDAHAMRIDAGFDGIDRINQIAIPLRRRCEQRVVSDPVLLCNF